MRGQLAYSSQLLKSEAHVPPTLDITDDVAVAEMELLVPLERMRQSPHQAHSTMWADSCDFTKPSKQNTCALLLPCSCSAALARTQLSCCRVHRCCSNPQR